MTTSSVENETGSVAMADGEPATPLDGNIFMSYRRDDSADVVGRILDRLNASFADREIFRDVDDIPLGVDFKKYIGEAVAGAAMLLVAIGPRWAAATPDGSKRLDDPNDFVRLEVEAALERDIPVIPLLVGGADVPGVGDLPTTMRSLALRNGIPIRPDPDFDHDVGRLIKGLEHFNSESLIREITVLEAQIDVAEADGDWAAAEVALLRLEQVDPGRDGLAARLAVAERHSVAVSLAVEAENAAAEGRWVDVLSVARGLRAADPDWSDPDRLEATAEVYLALSEARGLLAEGEIKAARAIVADILEKNHALPGTIQLTAEIDAARRARRRRPLKLGIPAAVLLIFLAVAIVSIVAGGGSDEQPSLVRVPAVDGVALSTATARVEAVGFVADYTSEHSESVGQGLVVTQDPAAGTEAEAGSDVRLVVSLGPPQDQAEPERTSVPPPQRVRVPAVSGLAVDEAKPEISELGLDVVVRNEYSDTLDEGRVISQDPEPGRELEAGSEVELVVSLGPPPVSVPDVKGMTAEEATEEIRRAGLEAAVGDPSHSETVERGRVISQYPEAGATVDAGSQVTLVVSIGKPLVEVPDVIGMAVEGAIAKLEDDGLRAVVPGGDHPEAAELQVIAQEPEAPRDVEAGSEVYLEVSPCPAAATVPSVVGLSFEEALAVLGEACLVGVRSAQSYSDTVQQNHVVSQDPVAGLEIENGSEVHLETSLGPESSTTFPPILDFFDAELTPVQVE